ncbi:hypothetical protein L211DRAFT_846499 [Terfezia boudieri ATCC MYA-4762]|uniref:Uncharacterized protein n=1 Tax=Terfezia boudieri ATCC MYA-4762 TaxID=1051890 RepID=A0A3N4LVM8_9PEZI|nr:hypothetical protein L211DRAFT_846499 [Terfezia boudieri ATCC MYA-4762]
MLIHLLRMLIHIVLNSVELSPLAEFWLSFAQTCCSVRNFRAGLTGPGGQSYGLGCLTTLAGPSSRCLVRPACLVGPVHPACLVGPSIQADQADQADQAVYNLLLWLWDDSGQSSAELNPVLTGLGLLDGRTGRPAANNASGTAIMGWGLLR